MPTRSQSGAALLVTLVLIALTSLLAFSGSQSTRLQQRLISNDQAAQIAFQAAEAALLEGLAELESAPQLANFCTEAQGYNIASLDELNADDVDKALVEGESIDSSLGGDDEGIDSPQTQAPRYAIGCIDEAAVQDFTRAQSLVVGKGEVRGEDYYFFRIFARGFGPNGRISRTLEARYVLQ